VTTLVQQYFSASARRFPDKVAVACGRDAIAYGALEARSNARARELAARGLARGGFVPFFLKKGVHAIEAILAILKADCAYVPLDASSPARRIADILAATRAAFVLVDDATEARLREILAEAGGANVELVNLDRSPDASDAPVESRNLSIDVAYVLFTSGSTGTPKGVMISHQMIVDYIEWCVETYQLDERDVIANHAPLYFDNSTFDLYTAFKTGASLHLVHDELNVIMTRLVPWIRDRGITTFFCVPSVMTILLKSGKLAPGAFPALRHVIAAGEVLPPEVVRRWMELFPHVRFANMYGPTEITVDCTYHAITEPPAPDATAIPIGKPRRNMEVFVLREDGTLGDAPGSEGEIVVRGQSVAYGYLGDPERTAAAFVQNPRHALFRDPLYRTGDLARIGPDGSFWFVGRRDQQIKYMGNRIELGEIESVLLKLEGVTEGVVVFHDAPAVEDKCIGALVVLAPGMTKEEVAAALQQRLPGYMVPRRITVAAEMPRTPNGKSDRRAALDLVFGD
jgi:D-alanine--poly(phosphoribitol) ligase subunit 1